MTMVRRVVCVAGIQSLRTVCRLPLPVNRYGSAGSEKHAVDYVRTGDGSPPASGLPIASGGFLPFQHVTHADRASVAIENLELEAAHLRAIGRGEGGDGLGIHGGDQWVL